MNLPLLKLVESDATADDEKARRLFAIARAMADTLARFDRITRQALKRHMVEAFGASDADGSWTMRNVAVVQLVTTAQAILDRRLADLSPQERASLDVDISPRDTLLSGSPDNTYSGGGRSMRYGTHYLARLDAELPPRPDLQ